MNDKEVAIIGLGPSGVSAAIYLKRFGMEPICFEKDNIGGKVNYTDEISNYPGFTEIKGAKLAANFSKQIEDLNIKVIYRGVKQIEKTEGGFKLFYGQEEKEFKYLIIANGLGNAPFKLPGEEKFKSRGISRCAICDGPLYRGKDVAVIGQDYEAFEEALYLSTICSKVYLISEKIEAPASLVEKAKNNSKIEILENYKAVGCDGDKKISSITLTGPSEKTIDIEGLFLYVGQAKVTDYIKIPEIFDNSIFIPTDENMMTKVKNLYAVGDCRKTKLRQVASAVSDGAIAANHLHLEYLREKKNG